MKMKGGNRLSVLAAAIVFVLLFAMGANAFEKGSVVKKSSKELAKKDHSGLVPTKGRLKNNNFSSKASFPGVLSNLNSRSKSATKVEKKGKHDVAGKNEKKRKIGNQVAQKAASQKFTRHKAKENVKKVKTTDAGHKKLWSILCKIIEFINKLFKLNFLRDLCGDTKPNITKKYPESTTQKATVTTNKLSSTTVTQTKSNPSEVKSTITNTMPMSITTKQSNPSQESTTQQSSSITNTLQTSTTTNPSEESTTRQASSITNTLQPSTTTNPTEESTTQQASSNTNTLQPSTLTNPSEESTTELLTTQDQSTSSITFTESTTELTTTLPLPDENITFFASDVIRLSCQRVPGSIIKIIEANYSKGNCPSRDVTSYMSQYSENKATLLVGIDDGNYLFGGACNETTFNGQTPLISGTYTCIRNTQGSNMVMDVLGEVATTITCPGGTMVVDDIMYGSMDDVTCPPTSVKNIYAFNGINDGVTSFSVYKQAETFNYLCDPGITKLTITYRCQTTSGSTFKSAARLEGTLNMVCAQGEINVTSVFTPSKLYPGCGDDDTDFIRSILPPKTSNAYFYKYQITNCSSSSESNITTFANYDCVETGNSSQITVAVQDYAEMVLECPVGTGINLLNSEFYCATNYNLTVFRNTTSVAGRCDGKLRTCSFVLDSFIEHWPSFSCSAVRTIEPKILSVTYTCI